MSVISILQIFKIRYCMTFKLWLLVIFACSFTLFSSFDHHSLILFLAVVYVSLHAAEYDAAELMALASPRLLVLIFKIILVNITAFDIQALVLGR